MQPSALVYRRENELSQAGTALAMLLGRSPAAIVEGFTDEGSTLEELNVFPRIPEDIPSDRSPAGPISAGKKAC